VTHGITLVPPEPYGHIGPNSAAQMMSVNKKSTNSFSLSLGLEGVYEKYYAFLRPPHGLSGLATGRDGRSTPSSHQPPGLVPTDRLLLFDADNLIPDPHAAALLSASPGEKVGHIQRAGTQADAHTKDTIVLSLQSTGFVLPAALRINTYIIPLFPSPDTLNIIHVIVRSNVKGRMRCCGVGNDASHTLYLGNVEMIQVVD